MRGNDEVALLQKGQKGERGNVPKSVPLRRPKIADLDQQNSDTQDYHLPHYLSLLMLLLEVSWHPLL